MVLCDLSADAPTYVNLVCLVFTPKGVGWRPEYEVQVCRMTTHVIDVHALFVYFCCDVQQYSSYLRSVCYRQTTYRHR